MKYIILAIGLTLAYSVFYFTAAGAKDQSRITDQAYVLEHILKGNPCKP